MEAVHRSAEIPYSGEGWKKGGGGGVTKAIYIVVPYLRDRIQEIRSSENMARLNMHET